jgi:hypothetical protein
MLSCSLVVVAFLPGSAEVMVSFSPEKTDILFDPISSIIAPPSKTPISVAPSTART